MLKKVNNFVCLTWWNIYFNHSYLQRGLCEILPEENCFPLMHQFVFLSIMYFASCETVLVSVILSGESNLAAVIFTNETASVDESPATIAHTLPVKYKSSETVASSFSTLSLTSMSLHYSLIVNLSYLTFVQPDHNFGKSKQLQ